MSANDDVSPSDPPSQPDHSDPGPVVNLKRELDDEEKRQLIDRTRHQLRKLQAAAAAARGDIGQRGRVDNIVAVTSDGDRRTQFACSVHRSEDGKKYVVATRSERATADGVTYTGVIKSCNLVDHDDTAPSVKSPADDVQPTVQS